MSDDDACRTLWANVVLQALLDAGASPGSWPRAPRVRIQAREWLTRPSPDLHAVLDATGLDPSAWHSRTAPELLDRWAAIDGGFCPRLRMCRGGRRGSPPGHDSVLGR